MVDDGGHFDGHAGDGEGLFVIQVRDIEGLGLGDEGRVEGAAEEGDAATGGVGEIEAELTEVSPETPRRYSLPTPAEEKFLKERSTWISWCLSSWRSGHWRLRRQRVTAMPGSARRSMAGWRWGSIGGCISGDFAGEAAEQDGEGTGDGPERRSVFAIVVEGETIGGGLDKAGVGLLLIFHGRLHEGHILEVEGDTFIAGGAAPDVAVFEGGEDFDGAGGGSGGQFVEIGGDAGGGEGGDGGIGTEIDDDALVGSDGHGGGRCLRHGGEGQEGEKCKGDWNGNSHGGSECGDQRPGGRFGESSFPKQTNAERKAKLPKAAGRSERRRSGVSGGGRSGEVRSGLAGAAAGEKKGAER